MPLTIAQQVGDLQPPGDVVNILNRAAINGVASQQTYGNEQKVPIGSSDESRERSDVFSGCTAC